MRKRQKNKLRSCGLCKPHKTGGSNRWNEKEFAELKESEKELLHINGVELCKHCGKYHQKGSDNHDPIGEDLDF